LTANTFVRAKPDGSGFEFFNYKYFFSTVLMAFVDADCKFIAIEVGATVRLVTNIFKKSNLYKRLERNELNIPKGGPLRKYENVEHMPFVIVGDEAFALSENVLRSYPHRNLGIAKRIFKYILTRARKMVKWWNARLAYKGQSISVRTGNLKHRKAYLRH
jgi:hypothetical protein